MPQLRSYWLSLRRPAETLAIAAVGLLFALDPPDFLQYIVVFSGTGLSATFLIPTMLALYWPAMNKTGCMAGILGGSGSFLAQYAAFGTKSFWGFDPFVWALPASLACCILGAWVGEPDKAELKQKYFRSADP